MVRLTTIAGQDRDRPHLFISLVKSEAKDNPVGTVMKLDRCASRGLPATNWHPSCPSSAWEERFS